MSDDKHRQHRIVEVLLERHGQTYAEEIGIRLKRMPAPLFQVLVASILFSTRIAAPQAVKAMRALLEAGWTTADHLAETEWEERVRVLNENGYARYDESTASMLGETCEILLEKYDGDLRNLRRLADHDVERERTLLTEFKGLGPAGADIFLREVQAIWSEAYPLADAKAAKGAESLGLPRTGASLAELVEGPEAFARLVAALVRVSLAGDAEEIRHAASEAETR